MTELKHHTRNIRIAPRKLRLVVDQVRHLPANKALDVLPLVTKRGALHVAKSLKAAIAAAKDKDLNLETLVIQRIWADEGMVMKRVISGSRGRANRIMKPHSHLTIVLKGESGAPVKVKKKAEKAAEPAAEAEVTAEEK